MDTAEPVCSWAATMADCSELESEKLKLEVELLRRQARSDASPAGSVLRFLSAFGGSLAGVAAILYVVGYLISFGQAAKLGMPMGSVAPEAYLMMQGARFPLGLASAVLDLYLSIRWVFWAASLVLALSIGLALWRRRVGSCRAPGWRRGTNAAWVLAAAWLVLLASLYFGWQASSATNLLLRPGPRMSQVLRGHGDLRQSERLLSEEAGKPDGDSALTRQYEQDVAERRQRLATLADELPLNDRLVYWIYFRAMEPGVPHRLTGYYLLVSILTLAAGALAGRWFRQTRGIATLARRVHVGVLGGGLFLSLCLAIFDYGVLMLRSEADIARLACGEAESALLGRDGDRLVLLDFNPPRLRLVRAETVDTICVPRRADVFSEILRHE